MALNNSDAQKLSNARRRAREAMAPAFAAAFEKSQDDTLSAAQQAKYVEELRKLTNAQIKLTDLELKSLNDAVANSGIVDQLSKRSKAVLDDANKLKDLARTIDEVADTVGKVTNLVSGLAGLFI